MEFKEKFKKHFIDSLNGQKNSIMGANRQKAFNYFLENELPNRKTEEYKYTPISKELLGTLPIENSTSNLKGADLKKILPEGFKEFEGFKIVFYNGYFVSELSKCPELEGVEVKTDFGQLSEKAQKKFGTIAKYESDIFTAVNTAFSNQGVVIEVLKNNTIELPFLILYLSDNTQTETFTGTRNLFLLGENTELSLVEAHVSLHKNSNFNSHVFEFIIEENARVNHLRIQDESSETSHYNHTGVVQKSKTFYGCNTISLNGKIIRNNHHVLVDGEGCESELLGLYILKGKTLVDNHTLVDHQKPNSFSNEYYKGILDESSTAVFNGKIFVRENAQKTNAFQSNKNILLTNEANINTKPQLEIWADDVKCSHGCTIGQLDEEQIFYLRTRGISRDTARAMILLAFAAEIVTKIKFDPIRLQMEELITERLNG